MGKQKTFEVINKIHDFVESGWNKPWYFSITEKNYKSF